MGATSTPTLPGESITDTHTMNKGGGEVLNVPMTFTLSNSYATGGDTLTQPTSDVKFGDLVRVTIANPFDGTRYYWWDGSTSAPKIKATKLSAGAYAEETATTDLSAVSLIAVLTYQR